MNKYISVNKEGIKALQRTFKVKGKEICERCVKNALAYRTNNELARKIRFAAIKHHGVAPTTTSRKGNSSLTRTVVRVRSILTEPRSTSTSRPGKV